jgi:hypothetical protein
MQNGRRRNSGLDAPDTPSNNNGALANGRRVQESPMRGGGYVSTDTWLAACQADALPLPDLHAAIACVRHSKLMISADT